MNQKLTIILLFFVTICMSQEVTVDSQVYQVKQNTVLLNGIDVTNDLNQVQKEKIMSLAKLKREQLKNEEKALKQAKKDAKAAKKQEKELKRIKKAQKKTDAALKKKEKTLAKKEKAEEQLKEATKELDKAKDK